MPIKFCSEAYSSGLRFFKEPHGLKYLQEDLGSGVLRSEKVHRPQPGLLTRTSDLEASTLFWPNRIKSAFIHF